MLRRTFATALLGLLLAACGGDKSSGPSGHAGTYTLRTVNGSNVPFTMVSIVVGGSVYKLEVLSGSITLNADGTFSQTATFRETDGTDVTTESYPTSGTYTLSGTALTLNSSDGESLGGSLSGGAITFVESDEGQTLTVVFRK